jgi:hypothetical protein
MSLTNECFVNVVGLSRTDCECFGTPPTDYDVSASDLYLDEVNGFNIEKVFKSAKCSEDGWDILTRARENGLKMMKAEVLRGVQSRTKSKRPSGRATIGKEKGTKALTLSRTYHGLDVKFANHVGGLAVIKRIGAAFKFSGSVTVTVYDSNADVVATRTIEAVQNRWTWTDITPIEIELGAEGPDNVRYWFLYQPTTGQQALDQKVASCGCGGKPKWSTTHPFYESAVVQDGQLWTAWAMASGTYGSDLTTLEDWTHTNETQGLSLDIEFSCDGQTVMCSGGPNYQQDPVQMSFAMGVQYFAALAAIAEVTGSTRVIREAIAGGDQLELTRVALMKDAEEMVGYVVDVLSGDPDPGNSRSGVNLYSDCFSCKDETNMHVRRIPS